MIAEDLSSRINTEGHLIEKVSDPAAKTKGDHDHHPYFVSARQESTAAHRA